METKKITSEFIEKAAMSQEETIRSFFEEIEGCFCECDEKLSEMEMPDTG